MTRKIVAAIGLLCATLSASAADFRVRVQAAPGTEPCLHDGSLVVRALGSEKTSRIALQPEQLTYSFAVGEERGLEITAETKGCWSDTIIAAVELGESTLTLRRAGTIAGDFEVNEEGLPAVRGTIFPLPSNPRTSGMTARCASNGRRWKCAVPADTPLDLRLDLDGFASVHYWSVVVGATEMRQLEPQPLRRGASIGGWLETSKRLPITGAKVTLYPLSPADAPIDARGQNARRQTATSNDRGYFQFTGLSSGRYRLVSEAEGWSPATLPEIRLRENQSLIWPTPIVHPPFASVEAALSPSTDKDGGPWLVELSPTTLLHEPAPPIKRRADATGKCVIGKLRADVYRLSVRDSSGSVLETLDVDLSEGVATTIHVNVRSIIVSGVVRLGSQGLPADLTFANGAGKIVRASASDDGEFRAAFPAGGAWTPSIRYPRERGSTITLEAVDIDPNGDSSRVELRVPGGRLRGETVGPHDEPTKAAVHVVRNGQPVARVITPDDGKFDFVGLRAGSYTVEAESLDASTPAPLAVEVKEDDTSDVRLTLTPIRRLSGVILTPSGAPASGAVVEVMVPGNRWWNQVFTDATGQFEYRLPSGSADVTVVVLTYDYPAAIVRVPGDARGGIAISLKPTSGLLRVRNGNVPYLWTSEAAVPVRAFYFSRSGGFDAPIQLEPGGYVVCPGRELDAACRRVTLMPGALSEIDFKANVSETRTR